jgi:hypothetical protein
MIVAMISRLPSRKGRGEEMGRAAEILFRDGGRTAG